ncbi:PRD domain-containing protein [Enterococcus casseliflavus]|uniref:PRD domain-containing protein n=1 Tax=Enterococcus casseliflavus TaxID=37734 RepID=UPI001432BC1C|nr:PRD domain-containing protein [Enterococcus casseliflavus]NKD30972.1 PRD domain-containing protein [Enterococcus casseliflavus]NKD34164.1 PRD domain-containing protein [Enterococcus casseliflavus]
MQKEDSYEIHRIINNNVITSRNKQGKEIVLMGKGVAYLKKVGDTIESSVVEKQFILTENELTRYVDVIEAIPADYIELAIDTFNQAEQQLKIKPSSIAYVMLADHLHSSVERAQDGIFMRNEMLNEIKNFFPKEYEISKQTFAKVEQMSKMRLPSDEIGFIAFHILNVSGGIKNDERIKMIDQVTKIIEDYFSIKLRKESIYYERFLTHMKYFCTRLFSDEHLHLEKNDTTLFELLRTQHPNTSKCVDSIQEYIEGTFQVKISKEEKGFLIIHINNLIMKSKMVTE